MKKTSIKIKPYNEDVWLVISKINKHVGKYKANGCIFTYGLEKRGFPAIDVQQSIVEELSKQGYLEIKPINSIFPNAIQNYFITRSPKFDKLLEEYKKHFEQDDIFLVRERRSIFVKIGDKKWLLSKQNLGTENDDFYEYVFTKRHKGIIKKTEIEKTSRRTIKKPFHQIIKDGGFVRVIKGLFFPEISKDILLIRQHIQASKYKEFDIDIKNVINWLNKNKKSVKSG